MVTSISARLHRHQTIVCGGEVVVPVGQPIMLTIPKPIPAGSGYIWALQGPLPKPGAGEVLVLGEETTPADIPGAPITTTWVLEWFPPANQPLHEVQPTEELRFVMIRPWEAHRPVETCNCKIRFE
ncbi:MAG TPA: protease inhibitor I42 family protein [Ktedonobacteraceae bacterium]|nr:protease inhibitor I42 family protein [Ktedonobacteraceae bacterium]